MPLNRAYRRLGLWPRGVVVAQLAVAIATDDGQRREEGAEGVLLVFVPLIAPYA